MPHLRTLEIDRTKVAIDRFPFDLPTIASLARLELDPGVTFLVGENGTGKSTLLEALAWAVEAVVAGSDSLELDATLAHVRPLGEALRLTWNRRTRRGFFLRAEDFFGYVRRTRALVAEMQAEIDRVHEEFPDLPEVELARRVAPYTKSIAETRQRYGEDIDAASHGEQFLAFFQSRLVPGGLYLLDEPEAPLSPTRQLALLSVIRHEVAHSQAQFVISTHSPILMALPDATILSFDAAPVHPVAYDELEHVRVTRDFLSRPGSYLRHL